MGWESISIRHAAADSAAVLGPRVRDQNPLFTTASRSSLPAPLPTYTTAFSPQRSLHEISHAADAPIPPQAVQWSTPAARPLQHLIAHVSSLISSAPGPLGVAQLMHGVATHSIETPSGARFSVPQLWANGVVAKGRDVLLERGLLQEHEADLKHILSWSELSSPDNLLAAALGGIGLYGRPGKRTRRISSTNMQTKDKAPNTPSAAPDSVRGTHSSAKIRFPKERLNKLQIQLREVKLLEQEAYQALRQANALLVQAAPNSPEYKALSQGVDAASNKWAKHQSQKLALLADIERIENWVGRFRRP